MTSYPSNINYIKTGEPVTASVTNRPIQQTASRTDALKQRLDAVSAGQSVFLYDVPVEAKCAVGMPVYWNKAYNWFSPAQAGLGPGCDDGSLKLAESADVIGLVYSKASQNTATLILFGTVNLPEVKNYLGSHLGRFYLGMDAGSLTSEPPAAEVPIGVAIGLRNPCDTGYWIYVNPEYSGRYFNHIHLKHSMGTSAAYWTDASSDTHAPEGAVYSYNFDADSQLKSIFPPIPLDACSFEVDWGASGDEPGSREVDFIKVTPYGIYWCESGYTPFASDAGVQDQFSITMCLSRVQYSTKDGVVTSLNSAPDSPVRFVNCNFDSASAGDLYAEFDMPQAFPPSDSLDGTALHDISSELNQNTVPVIHGIRSLNGNAIVSGTSTSTIDGMEYQSGVLTIGVKRYASEYEIQPEVIRLDDALESTWQNIPYIGMPYTNDNSILVKFPVPGVFGSGVKLRIRLTGLAPIAGTWPELEVSYMRIPRPSQPLTAESVLPYLTFTTMQMPEVSPRVEASSIIELETDPVSIVQGDTIMIRISRTADTGYASSIGLIRITGILDSEV